MLILLVIGFPRALTEKSIIVAIENKEIEIKGKYLESLRSVLRRNDLPNDSAFDYSESLNQILQNISKVKIKKKIDGVIKVDQEEIYYSTGTETVEELLKEKRIKLHENDFTIPSIETTLSEENSEIRVVRVRLEALKSEKKEVPIPVSITVNPELNVGTYQVIQEGKKGIDEVKEQIRFENEIEIGKEVIAQEIIEPTMEEIIEVGPGTTLKLPKDRTVISVNGRVNVEESTSEKIESSVNENGFRDRMVVNATAYTATGNGTASGTWPKSGRTIATWDGIPFGTRVYIPDLNGVFVVEDRGGAVTEGIIDIYMDSQDECTQWGRRDIEIFFLDE
ncbi:MAG: G5 domain-containing protein [Eubacteriaceae bacterium]